MNAIGKPNRRGRLRPLTATVVNIAAVLVAFALVWVPEITLYWTGVGVFRLDDGELVAARTRPATGVLDEIAQQYLGIQALPPDVADDRAAVTALAEAVLTGQTYPAGYPAAPLAFPFRASNLEVGLPRHQLLVASMASTRSLLHAWRVTGERRYLTAALEEATAFARVDQRRLIPRGLLWNDHALATRIAILAELWSAARGDPALGDADARSLLELAERTAVLLAKPALYTYRTNHGVMQNIALLQFAAAFPTLTRAGDARAVGCRRLEEQMAYYVSPDGIALEHSAGYHELGRQLLSVAVRLFVLNGCPLPADWRGKLAAATEFSHLLTRPDRTVPAFGNSDHAPLPPDEAVDTTRPPARATSVFPAAGYAVWWHGLDAWPDASRLSQTVVTWSNFPSRAHKLADDMSVLIWSRGRPWITTTGYWPYGVEGYDDANGWRGSNAPHVSGERRAPPGATTLRRLGEAPGMRMLELQRQSERGTELRRQIVELDGSTWIVVDSAAGPPGAEVDTLWTTMPASDVRPIGPHDFAIVARKGPAHARIRLLGAGIVETVRKGELQPFAGWVVDQAQPSAAPSIEVRTRTPGTVVTVLSVGAVADWQAGLGADGPSPDAWTVILRQAGHERLVRLAGDRLIASVPAGRDVELTLDAPGPAVAADRRRVTDAYERVVARYPGFRELTFYRHKVTWLLLGLLLGQELVVRVVMRWSATAAIALRWVAAVAWLLVGLWAVLVYLR